MENFAETGAENASEEVIETKSKRGRRASKPAAEAVVKAVAEAEQVAESSVVQEEVAVAPKRRPGRPRKSAVVEEKVAAESDSESVAAESADDAEKETKDRRERRNRRAQSATAKVEDDVVDSENNSDSPAEEKKSDDEEASAEADSSERSAVKGRSRSRSGRAAMQNKNAETAAEETTDDSEESNGSEHGEQHQRQGRTRTRQRDRKRRGDDDEPQLAEDDILVPVSGVLDVLDNYAFVRTTGYHAGQTDVYVSLSQVKRHGMRKGDTVIGAVKQPREGEQPGRQKYNALVKVDSVNGQTPEEAQARVDYAALTPISPVQGVTLSGEDAHPNLRAIDMFVPVALGQRGLIAAGNAGLTTVIQQMAQAFTKQAPDAHVMTLFIGARPEEVTELERSIDGEVIASSSDAPAEEQISLTELVLERAKRLVELGHDVVLFIDNLSQIATAVDGQLHRPGRTAVPGVIDPGVIATIKRLLSQARNLENGGSLAIYAGVDADTDLSHALMQVQNWYLRLEDIYLGEGAVNVNVLESSSRLAINPAENPQAAKAQELRLGVSQKLATATENFAGEHDLRLALAQPGDTALSATITKLLK